MPSLIDRTGQRYGSWTVLRRSAKTQAGRAAFWDCRCDCGTLQTVVGGNLASGISTNCGCLRTTTTKLIEPGSHFGAWTVLERGPVNRRHDSAMWLCRCVCGTVRNVRSASLRKRGSLSCGCTRDYAHNTFPAGDVREFIHRFNAYKEGAHKRGFAFELTLNEFAEIAKLNCTYCGAEPAMPIRKERVRAKSGLMNGVDRVDSTKGYSVANCVPCCTICNEMKLDRSVDAFLAHARRIVAHNE